MSPGVVQFMWSSKHDTAARVPEQGDDFCGVCSILLRRSITQNRYLFLNGLLGDIINIFSVFSSPALLRLSHTERSTYCR